MPYHKCTEKDYAQFRPINEVYKTRFEDIKTDKNRGFFCIDFDKEDLELGISKAGYASYIDIMLVPCNYLDNEKLGLTKDDIPKECKADLKA